MSDAITRLNAALEGRYAIERELGEGGCEWTDRLPSWVSGLSRRPPPSFGGGAAEIFRAKYDRDRDRIYQGRLPHRATPERPLCENVATPGIAELPSLALG